MELVFQKEEQRGEETGGVYAATTAITAASVRAILLLAQGEKKRNISPLAEKVCW